tara:strand:+ start:817 stop:1866 length:1050 start_codon:yes stop_codon:yes gene_type:complete
MNYKNFLKQHPFNFNIDKLDLIQKNILRSLNNHHLNKCKEYKKIIKNIYDEKKYRSNYSNMMLPINLFKNFELKSISNDQIFRIMLSSGTSGLQSKIFLDKENALKQKIILHKIVSEYLGSERLPMLIIDKNPKFLKDKMTAKEVAIIGFSIFGKDHTFLLDESEKINFRDLNNFLEKYQNKKFLIFGFTSQIFENLIEKKISNKIDMSNAICLHGGGWKKIEKKKISKTLFKKKLSNKFGIKTVINYYGLIEQTGSIFLESPKCGFFHNSIFSDIIIRDPMFNIRKNKKKGLVQLVSVLPTSYPGHNILTEDIGEIVGENDCLCGKGGKYFLIHGREEKSEIRGCSDV